MVPKRWGKGEASVGVVLGRGPDRQAHISVEVCRARGTDSLAKDLSAFLFVVVVFGRTQVMGSNHVSWIRRMVVIIILYIFLFFYILYAPF